MNDSESPNRKVLREVLRTARLGLPQVAVVVLTYQRKYQGTVFARLYVPVRLRWLSDCCSVEVGMPEREGNRFSVLHARVLESELVEMLIGKIDLVVNYPGD